MSERGRVDQGSLLNALRSEGRESKDAQVLWKRLSEKIFIDVKRKLEKYKGQLREDLNELALDLTQEVCLKILKSVDSFEEKAKVTTWIFRIVNNSIIDRVRAKREFLHMSEEQQKAVDDKLITSIQGGGEFSMEELLSLKEAIGELSPNDQALFFERLSGATFEEMADGHNIPVGTALSRNHRIKKELENRLKDE